MRASARKIAARLCQELSIVFKVAASALVRTYKSKKLRDISWKDINYKQHKLHVVIPRVRVCQRSSWFTSDSECEADTW